MRYSDMFWVIFITALFTAIYTFESLGGAKSKQDPLPEPVIQAGVLSFDPVNGYATKQEYAIIKQAEAKLKETVSSKCFGDFILNRKMIQTEGKTSAQVLEHIRSLKESVPVVMYYRRFTTAVAYRQPPSKTINLNRKYFYNGVPVCDWASTMGHEALGHALGNYTHDFKWTSQREYSVPYSIGYGVKACCK